MTNTVASPRGGYKKWPANTVSISHVSEIIGIYFVCMVPLSPRNHQFLSESSCNLLGPCFGSIIFVLVDCVAGFIFTLFWWEI